MTGILTFHNGPNYGGFLQAWHMREAVRSLGHQATVINYQGAGHHKAENKGLVGFSVPAFKSYIHRKLKARPFAAAITDLSGHPFTTNPKAIPWADFSSVVVGADIVWDFSNRQFGDDPVYYGAHPAQKDARFVAYAPSCGEAPAEGDLPDHVRRGIARFSSIQVRDTATARLTERVTGAEPPLVVDPTWLQDDPVERHTQRPDAPYTLVYGYGAVGDTRAATLAEWTKKRGLKLVSAASPCPTADIRLRTITPFGWVDLFRHAECVVTSTFHGLLYALKYHKPVVFMVRGPSRSKSSIVIDRCGLKERVVEPGQPFDLNHLDHCLTQASGCEIPEQWRKQSLELLRKSLEV